MADTKNYNPVLANHVDKLDEYGHEIPDPEPVAIPVEFSLPPSLAEQVLEILRGEQFRAAAEEAGWETFEEANDFECEDYEPTSPYELSLDQELYGEQIETAPGGPGPVSESPQPVEPLPSDSTGEGKNT